MHRFDRFFFLLFSEKKGKDGTKKKTNKVSITSDHPSTSHASGSEIQICVSLPLPDNLDSWLEPSDFSLPDYLLTERSGVSRVCVSDYTWIESNLKHFWMLY